MAGEPEPIPAARAAWLREQLPRWRAEGLLDDAGVAALEARYRADERRTPVAFAVVLGFLLAGVGLVLLVAANVDFEAVGPGARFAGVVTIWLASVAAAEVGVARVETLRVLVGPLRVLVVVAYGATILQATQSLQVPAFDPAILAAWALGSLAYAYAVSSFGATVLGISIGVSWYLTTGTEAVLDDEGAAVVLGLALPVPVLLAVAVAHAGTGRAALGDAWRGLGVAFGLAGLFLGAIPGLVEEPGISDIGLAAAAVGLVAACVAGARGSGLDRLEVGLGAAIALAALVLVTVAPEETTGVFSEQSPSGAQVAFSLLGVAVFVAAAVGVALLGVRRRSARVADLAAAGLFLFLLVQSFGVLAPLASGAALVLGLGVVLVVGGVLVDRGRRRLREEVGA